MKQNYVDFNMVWFEVHSLALLSVTPVQGLNYFKKTTLIDLAESHPLFSCDYDNSESNAAVAGVMMLVTSQANL